MRMLDSGWRDAAIKRGFYSMCEGLEVVVLFHCGLCSVFFIHVRTVDRYDVRSGRDVCAQSYDIFDMFSVCVWADN